MKSSVNKFDYPTACSHAYKVYKQDKSKQVDPQLQKIKYRQFDRQQRQIERTKAQKQKQRKMEIQRKENKKKIQQELERKKKQLIELQKMKNMALQAEKKSHELAIIRQEEERLQKLENQRRSKENQYNAQNRFLDALRRLEQQKDVNSKKQKQAVFRRKVIEQTQKFEREKAIKYREQVQQKQKAMIPQQKCSFANYKQPLGRTAYNKIIDYSKTYLHNPSIIVRSLEEQQNAIEKAQRQKSVQKQKQQERRTREQQNARISRERGKAAMDKIVLAKEYEDYVREQQEKARLYNVQRIEAGKKNQYTGVKPGTLGQMQINKKIRVQQQFEQMFFNGQNPQWFDKPANRYNMIQNRLIQSMASSNNTASNIKTRNNFINSRSIGSVGAVVSDSHYSFQSQPIQDLTSVKKVEEEHNAEKNESKKRVIPLPKNMADDSLQRSGGKEEKKGEELSYSQSEDESR